LILIKKEIQERQGRKAPKGKSESPWSPHIGSFGKILFIFHPRRLEVNLISLLGYGMGLHLLQKYSYHHG
jgi:hypothetical protein